jgi:hypothetical protein
VPQHALDGAASPNASRCPSDVLDALRNPDAVLLSRIISAAPVDGSQPNSFGHWIRDRRNRRVIPHRLEKAGYLAVRNPDRESDGLWKINGVRQVIYAKASLSFAAQVQAARALAADHSL